MRTLNPYSGVINGCQCRTHCRAVFIIALSLSCLSVAGCRSKEAKEQAQKAALQKTAQQTKAEISDSITANDVSRLKSLLPKDGTTDFDAETYKEFLDIAAKKFAKTEGKSARIEELPVIGLLSSRLRHQLGKPIDITGTMKVNLTMQGYGNFIAEISMKSKEGALYQPYISTKETEYVNTYISDEKFLADSDATYRIRGFMVGKNLEAERVELLAGGNSGNGMVIPVNPFLPSTAEFLSERMKQHQSTGK